MPELHAIPVAAQKTSQIVPAMTVIAEAYQKLNGQLAKAEHNENSLTLIQTILEKSEEARQHATGRSRRCNRWPSRSTARNTSERARL